jgi:hypothetical protein
MHMSRAIGALRQAGFCVEAYPTELENLGRRGCAVGITWARDATDKMKC